MQRKPDCEEQRSASPKKSCSSPVMPKARRDRAKFLGPDMEMLSKPFELAKFTEKVRTMIGA